VLHRVLQGVVLCFIVLSSVAPCCTVYCRVLQGVVECCKRHLTFPRGYTSCCKVLQGVAGCCRVLRKTPDREREIILFIGKPMGRSMMMLSDRGLIEPLSVV